jgi:uncharacterized membrane protein YhaH (DUF805 family)
MGFFDAISSVFSKYVTFSGRAPRSEFWWFWLFSAIVSTAIDGGTMARTREPSVLAAIWHLAVLLPTLAVFVRRLHDTDKSGWWWWLWLIPVIGWIVLIVFLATRGTPGPNRFGPDPLGGGGGGWDEVPGGEFGPSRIPRVGRP